MYTNEGNNCHKKTKRDTNGRPLLEPSSPRRTFMADKICCAAGGDIDVPYR